MFWVFVALACLGGLSEEIFSGPQPGEKTPGFKVLDMNGPDAGKEVDHVTLWQGKPTLFCFIHELTRPGARLIRSLDDFAAGNADGLKALFVALTDDLQKSERSLPPAIKALSLKSIIGISPDGKEGPGAYGLNKDVTLTIVLAKENKVLSNWAIISPNETDFQKIEGVLSKLTEPPLDSPEAMKAAILKLRAELAALRAEVAALRQRAGPGGRDAVMEKK